MPLVVRKPRKFRPIQTPYDQFLVQNRQLKTTIDDNERRWLESLSTTTSLVVRRWWHHTKIRLGFSRVRRQEEFQIEQEAVTSSNSAWSESLSNMEERIRAREQKFAVTRVSTVLEKKQ